MYLGCNNGACGQITHSAIDWRMECHDQRSPDAGGTSLASKSAVNRLACLELCRLDPACNAVAWSRTETMCHMKKGFDLGVVTTWNETVIFDFCWEGGSMHIEVCVWGATPSS